MNGYSNNRMILNDVCAWLTERDYEDVANIISDKFSKHTWTVNGMIRTDVLKEIFERVYGTVDMFKQLQCDVTTYVELIRYDEAHVD